MKGNVSTRAVTCLPVLAAVVACGQDGANPAAPAPVAFQHERRVEISGHADSAMEPYISCDGRYLFFNNRNEPGEQTDLYVAERAGEATFTLRGPLAGANQPPPVLDAVPSLDVRGTLFFISTRSYEQTLSTLYTGDFREGRVENVRLVPGNVSRRLRGWLTMDAEINRDGTLLYFADARFAGGAVPQEADLAVARGVDGTFSVAPDSARLLATLNTPALEYAPATSADGLEIFFTRLEGSSPAIFRAARASASEGFGVATPIAGVGGFVEAPSLSCDGRTLFYHRREGGAFSVFRAERADGP
jgi:hypothetical protein